MSIRENVICDICKTEIPQKNYVEMILIDNRIDESGQKTDLCLYCFEKLRAFLRHGMPNIKKIKAGYL